MPATPPVDDDLFDQAIHWVLHLDEAPEDPDLVRRHLAWLAAAPAARAAAMASARAFLGLLEQPVTDLADQLDAEAPRAAGAPAPAATLSAPAPRVPPAPAAVVRGRRRRRLLHAAVASLALAIAAGGWLGGGGLDRLRSDAYTQVGAMRRLQLEDGSVVTLNTDSAIAVHMRKDLRTVRLLRGEAFFQVARDMHRPFVVDSAGGSARVLGTAFNVRLDDASARVSVVEGRVAVSPPAGGTGAVLAAGQSAWLAGAAVQREAVHDPRAAIAWRRRQLVFYNTPLSQVVDELARYRNGIVQVHGDDVRALPVSGSFSIADPDASLQLLLDSLQLDAVRLGWVTVVYRPAPAQAVPGRIQ
ncbi:FecR domain-containing protein [Xanthomonas sp. 1678]|uniref:FecR family protein n=1 Tax=Xanthomonas sp. 1678 TaxID=3158788 RepID=UPI0028608DCE|nr:transmembrane sensor [Xanthomonas translucens]